MPGAGNGIHVVGDASSQTIQGSALDDTLEGRGGDDLLQGLGGDDLLIGGTGHDTTDGGPGDDWHIVDDPADQVLEAAGEGNDRVFAATSYALAAGVEVETLTTDWHAGTDPIALTGNELAQLIYGNAGDNILNGGGGADVLVGAGGNDTLNGGEGGDTLMGGIGADMLNGEAGDDRLYGGADPAIMSGGTGDDWFFVGNAHDVIQEVAGEGSNDRVFASVSYVLTAGAQIEILSTDFHAGTASIDLSGNELANVIYGNAGSNSLDGGAGADVLVGLGGSDVYYVDDAGDQVLEAIGGGSFDRVFATASWTLAAGQEVEQVEFSSSAGSTLVGNEFAQTLVGNSQDNVLDGGGGVDSLVGRLGNDSYFVTAGDQIREFSSEGTADRVFAAESYTLNAGAFVEIMSTTNNDGTAAINLTGNEVAQAIFGNDGANILTGNDGNDTLIGWGGSDVLRGGAGSDTIEGGAGADTLTGGQGIDLYVYAGLDSSQNIDSITDFETGVDKLRFAAAQFGFSPGQSLVDGSSFVSGPNPQATGANATFLMNTTTHQVLWDADGTGSAMAIAIATLANGANAVASDFLFV